MARKRREPVEQQDSGWEPDEGRAPCDGKHAARLVIAMDFEGGYSNTYQCRECRATRTVSGPRS
jgi:hypothetical protein